jgi:protein-tyrosine phosphatase
MNRQPRTRQVLFLCTGNYYRSRFASELFDVLAADAGLDWRSFSRGLATERGAHNIGPMSPNAVKGLEARGIQLTKPVRSPLEARAEDLRRADLLIALKEKEHRTLVEERFPTWANGIEYWDIDDVEQEPPSESLAKMEDRVRELVARLKMALLIRDALPKDTAAIVQLMGELATAGGGYSPISEEYVARYLSSPTSHVLMAELEGAVVGSLSYSIRPDLYHAANACLIEELVVHEAVRGQGVGSALLREVMTRLEDAGCAEVSVAAAKDNVRALNLYRSLGFVGESILLETHFDVR